MSLQNAQKEFLQNLGTLDAKDAEFLQSAYNFALESHEGQFRKDGNPYFIHPLEVANTLFHQYRNIPLTAAGLLHDVVEDCENVEMKDIYENFGEEVGYLVDAVTLTTLSFYNEGTPYPNKTEKLIAGGAKNIGCLILKLADRKNNMETIQNLKRHKQTRMAFETQAIFIPIRNIIGFGGDTQLEEAQAKWDDFIHTTAHLYPTEILQKLYEYTFEDFNIETFEEAYAHTDKIIWEIHDLTFFSKLCENKEFDTNARITCIKGGTDSFCVTFKFQGPHLLDTNQGKMKLSSFKC